MIYLVALVSIPLTIELVGRLLAVRDAWSVRAARPRALQRLAVPVALTALLYAAASDAWLGLVIGAAFVLTFRILAIVVLRIALRRDAFQTRSIDTD